MEEEGVTFETCSNVGKDIKADNSQGAFDRVILACGVTKSERYGTPGRELTAFAFAVNL